MGPKRSWLSDKAGWVQENVSPVAGKLAEYWNKSVQSAVRACCRSFSERCLGLRLYWQEYPRLLKAAIVAIIAGIVLVAWVLYGLYSWVDDPSAGFGAFAEPLVLGFVYIIAYLTSGHLVARLYPLRAGMPGIVLEELEDPTTEPWRYTNHSYSLIRWDTDIPSPHLRAIDEFLTEQERLSQRGVFRVYERLLEETGSANFRVFSVFGRPRYIRIDKVAHPEDHERRNLVLDHVINTWDDTENLVRCLKPLPIKRPANKQDEKYRKKTLPAPKFLVDKDVWVQLYPYIDTDTYPHYAGRSIDELRSVAERIGQFQASLQSMDDQHKQFLLEYPKQTDPIARPLLSPERINAIWDWIRKESSTTANTCVALMNRENKEDRVQNWITDTVELLAQLEEPSLLLHDLHPHNVLCKPGDKGARCVLVFDYSWIGGWAHSFVLASTLHRFVREYAIVKTGLERIVEYQQETAYLGYKDGEHPPEVRQHCTAGASAFLESYRRYCPAERVPLPDEFDAKLGAYIRLANMDKLFHVLEEAIHPEQEIRRRSEERVVAEIRKFIRYIKESEVF